MRKRQRKRFDHGEPIAKIDTRPLAFVAMFLAIVFLLLFQKAPDHVFYVELWDGKSGHPLIAGSDERATGGHDFINRVTVSSQDALLWNGVFINESQLVTLLSDMQSLSGSGVLEYEPQPDASYDRSVKTLYLIQQSGAPFRIAGMEQHCEIDTQFSYERGALGPLAIAITIFLPDRSDDPLINYAKRSEHCKPVAAVHAPG